MENVESDPAPRVLSKEFTIFGCVSLVPAFAYALRAIYEQTILTWSDGPQMLGFTLAHEYPGFLLLGIAGQVCVFGWIIGFIVVLVRRKSRDRTVVPLASWAQFVFSLLVVAVFLVPYEWWQTAAVDFAGLGPHAPDQLGSASSLGQRYLIKALLEHGVNVDARDQEKETALNHACDAGQVSMADYLVSNGANLDAAPKCRKVPRFAAHMKPEIPEATPDDGLPKVPGVTVTVSASPPSSPETAPAR